MTREIGGLSEIVADFDAVLVDQYGVLHDGRRAFPGAREALDALRDRGLPVVALTNSGKRAAENAARLDRLGFPESLFTAIVSSGEVVWRDLRERLAAGSLAPGSRVLVLSRDQDRSVVAGLDLKPVCPGDPADLVIIASVEPERLSRERYREMLLPHAEAGVPAICANPDHVIYAGDATAFGPGIVAADYAAAAGGPVRYAGKPAADFFAVALVEAGNPVPARTLMIGDSSHHDIAGAAAVGIATLLVTGGVQAETGASAEADFAIERLVW